jgi:hypothetical protein
VLGRGTWSRALWSCRSPVGKHAGGAPACSSITLERLERRFLIAPASALKGRGGSTLSSGIPHGIHDRTTSRPPRRPQIPSAARLDAGMEILRRDSVKPSARRRGARFNRYWIHEEHHRNSPSARGVNRPARSRDAAEHPGPPPPRRRPRVMTYGLIRLILVAQLASDVRVLLQAPIGAVSHWESVQVWAMYSEAIQMLLPSTAVAP